MNKLAKVLVALVSLLAPASVGSFGFIQNAVSPTHLKRAHSLRLMEGTQDEVVQEPKVCLVTGGATGMFCDHEMILCCCARLIRILLASLQA